MAFSNITYEWWYSKQKPTPRVVSNTPKPTLFFRNNNKTIRCQKPRQHHLVHPICFVIANDCLIRLLEYNPGLWLNSKWWMRLSKAGQQQWDRYHSGSDILSNFVQCRIMPRGLIFYLATLQMIEDRDTLKQKKGKHSNPSLRPRICWGPNGAIVTLVLPNNPILETWFQCHSKALNFRDLRLLAKNRAFHLSLRLGSLESLMN